ncbi:MAG: hypothetical protein RQ754_01530 [Desulfuromonadales bacterium]|nr:hypothetical protein [Desulfuromonadales bacterium]
MRKVIISFSLLCFMLVWTNPAFAAGLNPSCDETAPAVFLQTVGSASHDATATPGKEDAGQNAFACKHRPRAKRTAAPLSSSGTTAKEHLFIMTTSFTGGLYANARSTLKNPPLLHLRAVVLQI